MTTSPPQYVIGTKLRATITFTNADDAAADPTTVVAKIRLPNREVETYTFETDDELVRISEGNYVLERALDLEGAWLFRAEGTGDVTAAVEGAVLVLESEFY